MPEPEYQHVLSPITRIQQLTELRVGIVRPSHLLAVQLPPLLQQLDVTVELAGKHTALLELAGWLRQHGRIVRHLGLVNLLSQASRFSDDLTQDTKL